MARFVVITDGSTALRIRRGPGTNFQQVIAPGNTLSVGTEFDALEIRNVAHEQWLRIGVNRWVNSSQSFGTVLNCLRIQSGWSITTGPVVSSSRLRVVNAPNGLNVRIAPMVAVGTLTVPLRQLSNNTIHNFSGQGVIDPRQPTNSNTRAWVRLSSRRWVSANHVAAA